MGTWKNARPNWLATIIIHWFAEAQSPKSQKNLSQQSCREQREILKARTWYIQKADKWDCTLLRRSLKIKVYLSGAGQLHTTKIFFFCWLRSILPETFWYMNICFWAQQHSWRLCWKIAPTSISFKSIPGGFQILLSKKLRVNCLLQRKAFLLA